MKDDFDTYSLFGGDAAGGATPREPAKRSSLRAVPATARMCCQGTRTDSGPRNLYGKPVPR